jgi:F-type H+-transporting ATPase subunit gamma
VASTRDIRSKIRSVRNIEQICRAMKTVASIRLRRAEQRVAASRPYRQRMAELVSRVAAVTQEHPFLQAREDERIALVLITGDRGLCGGYNANAVRRAVQVGAPERTSVIALGRKGLGQMRRRGYPIVDQIVPLGGEPSISQTSRLAERIGRLFLRGEVGRVVLVHAVFGAAASSQVRAETLLPVTVEAAQDEDVIFEPAPRKLLSGLMWRYLRSQVTGAVMEASASEHAARVAAMTAATDNAEEMIRELTLQYNKARQAGITAELTEIVSSAQATA